MVVYKNIVLNFCCKKERIEFLITGMKDKKHLICFSIFFILKQVFLLDETSVSLGETLVSCQRNTLSKSSFAIQLSVNVFSWPLSILYIKQVDSIYI